MALCLLPYGLLILGIALFAQIGMGMQEAAKSVVWYAANPDATIPEHFGDSKQRTRRFFFGDAINDETAGRGNAAIAPKSMDDPLDVDEAAEEPVLPYGNRINGRIDLATALSRGITYSYDLDGNYHAYDDSGIAAKLMENGVIKPGNFYDMDPASELELTAEGEYALEAAAALLGDGETYGSRPPKPPWLSYHEVQVKSYTAGLQRLPWGRGGRLPLESKEGAGEFRRDVTLRGRSEEPGGETPAPLSRMEMVVRNPDAERKPGAAVSDELITDYLMKFKPPAGWPLPDRSAMITNNPNDPLFDKEKWY